MKMRLLLLAALLASFSMNVSEAANYQWTGKLEEQWTSTNNNSWTQTAPWDGTPNPGPPTTNDNVFLGTANNMTIRATATLNGGAYAGAINDLTVSTTSAAGGSLSSYNGWISTLTIGNNIGFDAGATLLKLSDRNNSSALTVNVGNDVNIGAGQQLNLGYSGASQSLQKLTGFTVGQTTTVSGALKNGWANSISTINLGDLVLSGTGALTLAAELDSTTTNPITLSNTVSVRSLAGTGNVFGSDSDNGGARNSTLAIATAGTTDATFSGTLANSAPGGTGNTLHVAVSGAGRQTFSGVSTYSGTTTVNAGTLLVNGTHTISTGAASSTAYEVKAGGTLGGTGTINLSAVNSGITVRSTGNLAPGGAGGTPGQLKLNLGTGVLNVSEAVGSSNTGALEFNLGSDATAGTTYDQVSLTTGIFNIGIGLLEAEDFSFAELAGFNAGTYTLFNTNSTIVGSLGNNLTVNFSGGRTGTISLANLDQDVILTVIPEPGNLTLLLCAAVAMLGRRPRRRG